MSYTDYDLDEKKASFDEGTVGRKYCLWGPMEDGTDGGHIVQKGFSMCFANFVICEHCVASAHNPENESRWVTGECFKCSKKDTLGYSSKVSIPDQGVIICQECLSWANQVLNGGTDITIKPNLNLTMMKSTDSFKTIINAHLQSVAANDSLFAETLKKPNKNIDGCINYILNTVQKSGCNGFADEEIFGMAVHYYDEDNIKAGKPLSTNVVVNHQVELSVEEMAKAKQDALDKVVSEQKEKLTFRAAKKKELLKHTQPTLFEL